MLDEILWVQGECKGCQKTALSAKSRKLGSCAGTNRFLDNCTILFFIGCFSEASFGFGKFLWKTVCPCKHPSCRTSLCPKEMFGWLLAGWPSLSLWMDNKSLANDHFRLEATLQFYWASVIEFLFFGLNIFWQPVSMSSDRKPCLNIFKSWKGKEGFLALSLKS